VAGKGRQGSDVHFPECRAGDLRRRSRALDALRAEFEARGAPVKDGRWGYRLLVVEDLDGNQLFFNYPNEPPAAEPAN
jgi:hypothetical protein